MKIRLNLVRACWDEGYGISFVVFRSPPPRVENSSAEEVIGTHSWWTFWNEHGLCELMSADPLIHLCQTWALEHLAHVIWYWYTSEFYYTPMLTWDGQLGLGASLSHLLHYPHLSCVTPPTNELKNHIGLAMGPVPWIDFAPCSTTINLIFWIILVFTLLFYFFILLHHFF